jgi:tight adherence protein C
MHDILIQTLPWAVFIGIVCAIWGCASWFQRRDTGVVDRLKDLNQKSRGHAGDSQWRAAIQMAAENAPPIVAQALQVRDEREANRLRTKLHYAGYHAPHAMAVYMGIRGALTLAGCVLGMGFGAAVWHTFQATVFGSAVGVLLGALLPSFVLNHMRKQRQDRIFLALPEALDLLIIAVEVGQGFDAAIQRVTREIANTGRELAQELHLFSMQVHMGRNRREALHDLGIRTGLDDMNALASLLIQADRFGGAIAATLDELAESMRLRRRQLAEERAQKTAVKLLLPLILFIFPGVFVILVGPAAIQMYRKILSV